MALGAAPRLLYDAFVRLRGEYRAEALGKRATPRTEDAARARQNNVFIFAKIITGVTLGLVALVLLLVLILPICFSVLLFDWLRQMNDPESVREVSREEYLRSARPAAGCTASDLSLAKENTDCPTMNE